MQYVCYTIAFLGGQVKKHRRNVKIQTEIAYVHNWQFRYKFRLHNRGEQFAKTPERSSEYKAAVEPLQLQLIGFLYILHKDSCVSFCETLVVKNHVHFEVKLKTPRVNVRCSDSGKILVNCECL